MWRAPFGADRCSLPRNLDGQWGIAQAGKVLREAALQTQIGRISNCV
jgi:hypothetical protein